MDVETVASCTGRRVSGLRSRWLVVLPFLARCYPLRACATLRCCARLDPSIYLYLLVLLSHVSGRRRLIEEEMDGMKPRRMIPDLGRVAF